MTETVGLPLWIVIIGGILAAWALLKLLILPVCRWYLRRRTEIVISKVNEKLDVRLPDFKLTKRRIIIDRLLHDEKVLEGVGEYARQQGISEKEAAKKAERYALEIVPAFNAYIYFRFGSWLSKSLLRFLYRVRAGFVDEEGLAKVDPHSSVVFIVNHRSNVDYILVAYLAINRVALSFAVGDWARVWPIQPLMRALGGFFVRRGSGNALYRCVLARYVQTAAESGVVQAMFPEGRLSRDGRLGEPKIGLLDYLLRNFDPNSGRDLVFIPVGINYDRVLEDRSQLLALDPEAKKKSRLAIIKTTLSYVMHNVWLMLRGGWHRFGYAVVNFGTPISMREYVEAHGGDFRGLQKEVRIEKVHRLAQDLMRATARMIPVVPVSLIAHVFVENPDKIFSELEIKARVQSLFSELEQRGVHAYVPRSDRDYAVEVGMRTLVMRHLVLEEDDLFRAASQEIPVLRYYANSIAHLLITDDVKTAESA